jgi:beta-barrel assembly-enhancing protease
MRFELKDTFPPVLGPLRLHITGHASTCAQTKATDATKPAQLNCALVRLLWPMLLCLATQSYAQSVGPTFPDPGKPHMSRDQQRASGLQVAAKVYEQMPVLPDSSPETQYIRQLGKKLEATIPPEHSWPFDFHVVAQKEINAFALPGGPMFVNIGTITAAANEAELAGVMGHEMSHVYMQHSAKQAGKEETTSILAGIAGAVLGGTKAGGGLVGQLGQMGIQMGAQGLMLKYSRSDESQADAVGAVILYKAGYNPQALADFFKTLETQGGPTPPQMLSDHPNPGNRERAIEQEIRDWPAQNYASDSPDFQTTRQHATEVKAYTAEEIAQGAKSGQWTTLNQKNGAIFQQPGGNSLTAGASAAGPNASRSVAAVSLQSVLPSEKMVTATLGPVKVHRPENWRVTMPEKQGQFATIAPAAGITSDGNVGYGVLLNVVEPPEGSRMTLDEITGHLVQGLEQGSRLQPLDKAEPIGVGGVEGRSVMLESASPFPGTSGEPQRERDWLVTFPQRNGSIIFMIFVAPQSDFARFQATYESMLKSVQIE